MAGSIAPSSTFKVTENYLQSLSIGDQEVGCAKKVALAVAHVFVIFTVIFDLFLALANTIFCCSRSEEPQADPTQDKTADAFANTHSTPDVDDGVDQTSPTKPASRPKKKKGHRVGKYAGSSSASTTWTELKKLSKVN